MYEVIDQRVLERTMPDKEMSQENKQVIENLRQEIDFIKTKLADKLNENEDLQLSLQFVKTNQELLANQFYDYKNDNNDILDKLLSEIDVKLSDLNAKQFSAIDNHIKVVLLDIMGYQASGGKSLADIDIKNWVRNIFVAKEFLEQKLEELNAKFDNKLKDELDRSAGVLMNEISERIKHDVLVMIETNSEKIATDQTGKLNLGEVEIKRIVKEALDVYDADKTGLVDYALETAGGEILSTRCTENYQTKSAQLTIFGIPLWYQTNTPRTAISPSVQPGQCWAFQGFPGFLVLKLNCNVYVTGFTMEHIPKSLAPNGQIDSAPKLFTVWGLENENDQDPVQFGKYEFLENGTSLQYFRVQNTDIKRPFNVAELRIESNHGNRNYTCLYRFRVHGSPNT